MAVAFGSALPSEWWFMLWPADRFGVAVVLACSRLLRLRGYSNRLGVSFGFWGPSPFSLLS